MNTRQLHAAAVALLVPWFECHGLADSAKALRPRGFDGTFATAIETYKVVVGAFRSLDAERRLFFAPVERPADDAFTALMTAAMDARDPWDADTRLANLHDATRLSGEQLEALRDEARREAAAYEAARAARAIVEKQEREASARAAAEAQREKEAIAAQRSAEAFANATRPRSCGVISNLTPLVGEGTRECRRAARSPEVVEWMRAQVAALPPDSVGVVRRAPMDLPMPERRPITAALLMTRSPGSEHWHEWMTLAVVDAIAGDGVLVVLTDSDDLGRGERAAIELAASRGIRVDVRRAPC